MSYARHSRTPLTIYCMSLHGEFMCDKEINHKGFHTNTDNFFWLCDRECNKTYHVMNEKGVPQYNE